MSDTEGTKRGADSDNEEKNGNSKKRKLSGNAVEAEEVLSSDAGVLMICGGINWDMNGRKAPKVGSKPPPKGINLTNLWGPHVWKENTRVKSIGTGCTSNHSALVDEEGKVYTWGRNDSGQLGLGDLDTVYTPTLVKELENEVIVKVATGRNHTLFLNDQGIVFACGSNKLGQLGLGCEGKDVLTPKQIDYKGKPIERLACGADFSMILDNSGGLHSFGSPEYGQLGHNTDGKILARANKITYDCEKSPRLISRYIEKEKEQSTSVGPVKIVDFQCGVNHTVATDSEGRVFTWGFGGYGRLGHAATKDEMVPRQVKQLENLRFKATRIAAGATFCIAYSAASKMVYFWGQSKPTGEATMYPKPLHDVCGMQTNDMSCGNKCIFIVGEDSVISWGASPTFGELGYGENHVKSSTIPMEVKPLDGLSIKEVGCGFAHTLFIARDLSAEERAKLAKFPRWP